MERVRFRLIPFLWQAENRYVTAVKPEEESGRVYASCNDVTPAKAGVRQSLDSCVRRNDNGSGLGWDDNVG